ncbi:proteasome stabiliser-domain-containing protein [Zychaea mexicana]|uniref:proteasome stabiliser-domain-containing protein n=1 Tax=Zychaea mexicana TaxID=64656 RepID=UPI0022FE1E79|nr:proteasome stabiliser-domain-containing protein [Zychaea mexicana]KAI9491193.1 proteasome stabiliser-domain-containing protein [Zychaea mexicana]
MASNELQLLENVELKIAMCNTDAQLERCINLFLAPVLLKLASPHEKVRRKVMELLSHINRRAKLNKSIKLPFDALLQQFMNDELSAMVKNFTIIYLEMCVDRMDIDETAKHIPSLLKGISRRPEPQRVTIFHMILPALQKWDMTVEGQKKAREDVFGFDSHPEDPTMILRFFLDLMLYQPSSANSNNAAASSSSSSNELSSQPPTAVYAGLSPNAVNVITNKGKTSWSHQRLSNAKLGVLKFVLSHVFTDDERLSILIAGACDANHEVVSTSEDGLRRWTGSVDLEKVQVIKSLYNLYLGTKPTNTDDRRAAASTPVKVRILNYLSKSIAATNMAALMVQVVFDGIYGPLSNLKLRRSTMSFLQWVARMADAKSIAPIAPIMISGLLKYIDQTGHVSGHDAESIKGYAYIGVGLICRKVPAAALKNVTILRQFFESLETEQPAVRTYVQDALSSIIDVYTKLPEDSVVYKDVQDIILDSVQKTNSYSRYMALKYANAVYPFSSVFARYVCLLGTSAGVTKLEVKEESMRGLHPFTQSESGVLSSANAIVPPSALPKFHDLIVYLTENRPNDQYVYDSKSPVIQGYPLEVYSEILRFARVILVLEANPETILIDEYAESKVDNGMSDDPVVMDNFKKYLVDSWLGGDLEKRRAVELWMKFIESSLDQNLKDPVLLSTGAKCLLEVVSLGPPAIAGAFQGRLDFFKALIFSKKQDARDTMSRIYGIIATDPSVTQDAIQELLSELVGIADKNAATNKNGMGIEKVHGALLTIGYLISRCNYRARPLSTDVVRQCVHCLASYLEGAPGAVFNMLAAAACLGLGEIGRTQLLGFLTVKRKRDSDDDDNDDKDKKAKMDVDSTGNANNDPLSSQDLAEKLARLIKTCKEPKVQEQAILTLGQLSIPLPSESTVTSLVIDTLFASADTKQVELFFAGGEALSVVAFGWDSQAMQKHKDIDDMALLQNLDRSDYQKRTELFQTVIEKIARVYVVSDRAWYRKASCIWFLSILKFGKDQPLIQNNLGVLHAAFSRLIADRDDFTQEVASKGLGLVYEYGDAKIKEDMLYSLVGTFTEGRSIQAQSVTDNTVLFEEGALGTTPDGNSITTYKELCSLASELNQPDLIYKFMSLANHNAMWTSRRGAAFGFQNLMSLAEKELEPYLPRLVPKLYRYQFDPNGQVNQTMKTIWRSLVKDNQKAVDKYFDVIMEDILSGLGSHQWRVREASCAAVTDLVQGRQLAQIEPYLERLWKMSFRALDDIKESVRRAATQTCKQLTKLTVHYCDPTVVSTSDGVKVMSIVMPFLLEKGIVSDAEDVRKFSLDALLRICKTGASLLKTFVPEIIDTLLQSLSSMEPQAMNYLTFHADKYNITQEQLDSARLSGAKNSPMMEGIEHCVNQIDDDVMKELSPRIISIVKKGTGLPTKAGCARFIVTLVMNRRGAFKPYADTFLKTLSGAIRSKNPVIRKAFATASGYVCQLATFDKICSFVRHLKKLYIEDTDEDAHSASALTAADMTRFATDRMNAVASEIVPLIYLGEHDPDEGIKKIWAAAWENLTSGTRSLVTIHADEIIDFAQPLLSSPSWATKQTAALAIADMCKIGGKAIAQRADKLMPVMVSTLATRSWTGKEHVLEAFVQLCVSAQSYFEEQGKEPTLDEAVKIMVRECKRKNRLYQRHALASFKVFADTFSGRVDILKQAQTFLTELCEIDEDEAAEDDENDNAKPLLLMIKANAFRTLVAAYKPKTFIDHAEDQQTEKICQTLIGNLEGNVWNVQLSILESLKLFFERVDSQHVNDSLLNRVLDTCNARLNDLKYSAIRTATVDVLDALVSSCKLSSEQKSKLQSMAASSLQKEPLAVLKERLSSLNKSVDNN